MKVRVKRTGAVIDAVRFDQAAAYARVGSIGMDLDTGVSFRTPDEPYLLTHGGQQTIADGDWVLTYADGGTEALSPADFAAACEPCTAGAMR